MSTHPLHCMRIHALVLGLAVALAATPAHAQSTGGTTTAVDPHAGHTMPAPAADPKKKKPAAATPAPAPVKKKPAVDPHAGHTMATPAPAKKKPAAAVAAPAPAKKKPALVDPHAGHTMATPAPAKKKPAPAVPAPAPAKKKPAPVDPHAGHDMAAPASAPAKKKPARAAPAPVRKKPEAVDPHAGHTMPPAPAKKKPAAVDPHAGHTMPAPAPAKKRKPVAVDPHAGHTKAPPAVAPVAKQPVADPHAGHAPMATTPVDHAAMGHGPPLPDNAPRTPIPLLTDADRAAAFPQVDGHAAHDKRAHSYWELDRLEVWDADPGTGVGWKGTAWIGGDVNRLWLRSEGEQVGGDLEAADLEVLGGHSVSRWWDVVAGVRHEVGEGPSQTFLAVGMQGLTPYKFDVEATAYLGSGGQTAARIEAEYDTLLTNRWILQWHGELEAHGQDDPRRGRGAGLGTVEAGVRLRFEVTRRFAPYIGLVHERSFGDTADHRRDSGEPTDDTRLVAGVRVWF